jgi:YXWGXW repeat-containing protein
MKMSTVDHAQTKTVSTGHETGIRPSWLALVLVLIFAALGAAGCEGYYSAYPGYGPYYGGPYYRGYGPYYGYPGSVTIAVGDRPYYVRGPGYWAGGVYYVWKPGHWSYRHGQKVWIHGHYVVRGY